MNALHPIDTAVRADRFNPDARGFHAYRLGETRLLGALQATTLDEAKAEATERWPWDRGDRLGIRETGQEDAPTWPFAKQPLSLLHVFAIRRSAPLRWRATDDMMRTVPVYKYTLDPITTIDLHVLDGAGE